MPMLSRKYSDRADLELLTTPQTIFSAIIRDIQRARRVVDMEFYIFEEDNVGRAFVELLLRKARGGVAVRMLLDGFGSRSVSRKTIRRLLSSGIDVRTTSLVGNCRNHRKIVVIDEAVAYTGGVNIADRYVSGNSLGLWHDVVLRISGDAVRGLSGILDYDSLRIEGVDSELVVESNPRVALYASEMQQGRAMERLLRNVADSARREIAITTPYLFPSTDMLEVLASAVGRGVKVRVVVPTRSDVALLNALMPNYVAEAMDAGIDVRQVAGAFVHAKMAVVDGERLVVGSANLDARSLRVNRELMVETKDVGVCRAAGEFIELLCAQSSPVESGRRMGFMSRILARVLSPVL